MSPSVLLLSVALLAPPGSIRDSVGAQVSAMIAEARHPWARRPDFPRYVDVLARLYASRGVGTVWLAGDSLSHAGRAAINELLAADAEGLPPADYDAATLEGLAAGLPHPSWTGLALARFDLLLSLDFVRYVDDLRGGRARPGMFGVGRAPPSVDLATMIGNAVSGDSVAALVTAALPPLAQYRNLRSHLSRYRALAADTSFGRLPWTSPVRPGEPYAGVHALRRRLVAIGDLVGASAADTGTVYDGPIVEGVRDFQRRHGLEPDGVLGRATIAALGVPFSARVVQIELALERLRGLPPLGHRPFIVVNIPAFELFAFDSVGGTGAPALEMKVVTGKALDTRTPALFEELRYVEFHPYWNVPRSILVKEILPRLRRQPGYLRKNDMEVVGAREIVLGDEVTPGILKRLAAGDLRVRQRPGPLNSLGLVKFAFPNAASVYMHGTPETALFSQTRRDFSHGCIRLEDPEALATWVLRDQPAWDNHAVKEAMADPTTDRVLLRRPMPVVVYYTTAVAAPDGTIRFYADVYGHDRVLLEGLRAGRESP